MRNYYYWALIALLPLLCGCEFMSALLTPEGSSAALDAGAGTINLIGKIVSGNWVGAVEDIGNISVAVGTIWAVTKGAKKAKQVAQERIINPQPAAQPQAS